MTRLLVSVRNATEAADACAGGARLIDVKEPTAGALGAATPAVWRGVVTALEGTVPISVALGELLTAPPVDLGDLAGVRFAKVGLAGCRKVPGWRDRLRAFFAPLRHQIIPVAVVYADEDRAESPSAHAILEAAESWGAQAVLIDTFDKSAGGIFDHVSDKWLSEFVARIQSQGWLAVVGGSLNTLTLPRACRAGADFVAVRGAACTSDRTSAIDRARVTHLASLLAPADSPETGATSLTPASLAAHPPRRV